MGLFMLKSENTMITGEGIPASLFNRMKSLGHDITEKRLEGSYVFDTEEKIYRLYKFCRYF